jgi:membrane protease subunit HflC
MARATILIPVAVAVLALALSAIFVVDEREKVLVLQFGEVKAVKETAGLAFKLPLIQEVVRYDDRILSLPTPTLEVTPLDDRRLVVDAFARWRIVDVVRFRQAVGSQGLPLAQNRLQNLIVNAIREVMGSVPSTSVLSADRTGLMNRIRDIARVQAAALGVDVIDVRLTRTDLPDQNLSATYARMRAEREREAADEIARGGEAAQRVRATADRTVIELTSEARKQAEIIRGEADGERNAIYADAFGRDPEFFAFTRSLTSYERALREGNSSIVMQPDSTFFDYLRSDTGQPGNGLLGTGLSGTAAGNRAGPCGRGAGACTGPFAFASGAGVAARAQPRTAAAGRAERAGAWRAAGGAVAGAGGVSTRRRFCDHMVLTRRDGLSFATCRA